MFLSGCHLAHQAIGQERQTLPLLTFVLNGTDDGRIDIDIDTNISRKLSQLLSSPPYESNAEPPVDRERTWKTKLNIVIQVVGSRGDVQPFIALGNELQKYGHRVRLATHMVFEDFVRKSSLEFHPIGGDPAELMAYMVKNPGLIPKMSSLQAGDIPKKRAMIKEILEGCWNSCIQPDINSGAPFVADAIIANPPSFGHLHCAQALGIPVHLMFTMPWSSTKAFPHPLANLKYKGTDPNLANYLSYNVVEFLTWQGIGDLVNKWRRETLELEPVPAAEGPYLAKTLKIPFTYCWSPALVPKPADWHSHIDVCGFFFRDPPEYNPPDDLREFLDQSPPPIYIGFGSIVIDNPENMTAIIISAIKSTGVRAIISRGWSKLDGEKLPNVLYLGDCPHEWLFQHVAAVIHHGGAGTTACGLLNGKPTTIVPFFGDQPFWGNMVAAAGAGPKPIPHGSLQSRNLAEAILFCLTPEASIAAQRIAEKMKTEDGVKAAVKSFHANLPREAMQCDFLPNEAAAWSYKQGKKNTQMSKLAAATIMKQSARLDRKALKLHQTKIISIENERWEPVTAVSSASVAAVTDMAGAAAGIFREPYKEYQRGHVESDVGDSLAAHRDKSKMTPSTSTTVRNLDTGEILDLLNLPANTTVICKKKPHLASSMAAASINSLGKVVVRYSKGVLVDIPLAATEGMRAVPRLYGEEVKEHAPITDWKSGSSVAGKMFVGGMYEGFTDIFVQTYKGKEAEGAIGVAKGLSKGLLSVTMKTGAATVGLVAYPSQGIYRSIRTAVKSKARKMIEEAKLREGQWMLENGRGNDCPYVVADFENTST
ncbi:sterol glucosyltransferase [Leptodontidium sp. MPI-SDFR-AT-0119]|nr:sterol glucosyltransferase [Leptodontidium sp. MPI-SDFR-AT-0119]